MAKESALLHQYFVKGIGQIGVSKTAGVQDDAATLMLEDNVEAMRVCMRNVPTAVREKDL